MYVPKRGLKLPNSLDVCPQKVAFLASVITLSRLDFSVEDLANVINMPVCPLF